MQNGGDAHKVYAYRKEKVGKRCALRTKVILTKLRKVHQSFRKFMRKCLFPVWRSKGLSPIESLT